MKKLVVKDESACKACLACESACSQAFYKIFDPALACIKVGADEKGEPKLATCNQCGKCMEACPNDAISQNAKGIYMIDKKKCTGCMKCQEVCPTHTIVKDQNFEYSSKCTACGICAKACPMEILEIVEC